MVLILYFWHKYFWVTKYFLEILNRVSNFCGEFQNAMAIIDSFRYSNGNYNHTVGIL